MNTPTPPEGARPAPTVACPTCKRLTVYRRDNPWRPFCSERCKQIDMGAWAAEDYRVEAKPPADGEEPA